MIDSKIAWCDDTCNVVEGCTEVDTDCTRCYARDMAARFAQDQVIARRESDGAPMASKPGHYAGLARLSPGRRLPQWTGKVRLRPDVLDAWFWRLLRARAARRQFLCSMGDLFHAEVPDAFLDEVFARIAILESRRVPQHPAAVWKGMGWSADDHPIYMLTKRPERAAVYTNAPGIAGRIEIAARAFIGRMRMEVQDGAHRRSWLGEVIEPTYLRRGVPLLTGFTMPAWPLRSVALITSAGTQAGAEARVPWLLRCKAAVLGVSCEPMTGPVDWTRIRYLEDGAQIELDALTGARWRWPKEGERGRSASTRAEPMDPGPALGWCILGGESGTELEHRAGPRLCAIEWMDAVAAQCKAAGVALFVKQLGNHLAHRLGRAGKGDQLEDLPDHLRIREHPRMPERP